MALSVYQDPSNLQTNPGDGPGTMQGMEPQYTPPPDSGGAPASGGGGGGGGGGYSPGSWNGVLSWDVPYLQGFKGTRFAEPDMNALQKDPGYMLRVKEGQDALERSAAARGVLRTGGTLKDLLKYNQNFASQEYNTAYQRALQAHQANYAIERDEYAPVMARWKEGANAARIAAQETYNKAYSAWELGEHNRRQASLQDSQPPA